MSTGLERRIERLEAAKPGPMFEILSDLSREERKVLRIALNEELATRTDLASEQRIAAVREAAEERVKIAPDELAEIWNRIVPKLEHVTWPTN